MRTKKVIANALSVLAGTMVTCVLFAGDMMAHGHDVTVAYPVSIRGLDLNQSGGARELYSRLRKAAWLLCTRTNRVGLEPVPNQDVCYEDSLAAAVRSAHMPLLVQAYLETHSLGRAAAHGIDVRVQLAAK